jgi:very-short-patch-repair endonuclease
MSRRNIIEDARELRSRRTEAEAMLWSVLRAKQVCGLKFRRQHPEPPWIIDFACHSRHLAVEIDGGYHDQQYAKDSDREAFLVRRGWTVVRFTNEEVRQNV